MEAEAVELRGEPPGKIGGGWGPRGDGGGGEVGGELGGESSQESRRPHGGFAVNFN